MIHLCIGMGPGIFVSACMPAAAGCVLFERTHHPADPLYGNKEKSITFTVIKPQNTKNKAGTCTSPMGEKTTNSEPLGKVMT